jgi:hypothetical protein
MPAKAEEETISTPSLNYRNVPETNNQEWPVSSSVNPHNLKVIEQN